MNYINNDDFYRSLKQSIDHGITNDFVENLYLLARNITNMNMYIKQKYKNDMIQSAVLKCIKKMEKFDLSKKNAFAYFTTIIRNDFYDTMRKEKKHNNKIDIDITDINNTDTL